MKKLVLCLVLVFAGYGCANAQEKRKTDSLVFTKFHSKVLDEERRIVVHLPLNYTKESTKKYPVMYVLDASRLDFDTADRLFTLSSAGMTPECIVVGVLNAKGARERDTTPPFMQTSTDDTPSPLGKGDVFLEFIQTELIPLIEKNYRTSGYRTLSGHSRSGLFVLYSLLAAPQLFNARFCYSTPAWRFDQILIKQLKEGLSKKPLQRDSYLFFSVGEVENPNIRASFEALTNMLKSIKARHLKWESYTAPHADHQSNPVFSTAKAMVSWSQFMKEK